MRADIKERVEKINRGEVPEGYKKVKKYIIPKNWNIRKLEYLVDKIVGGGTPSRDNTEYFNGDIPWATVKDLGQDNYKSDTVEYITQKGLENSSSKLIDANNLIISTRMGLGRGFINEVPMAINQDLKAIYPIKEKVNIKFLMYWFKSLGDYIEYLGGGSTVKGIDLGTLKSLELSIMSYDEQQKITSILSTWDKVIELKEKLIQQKKEQKKGLMQNLLTGKVRLEGFDGEWKEIRLGNVFERITRKNTDGNNNVLTISAQHGLISQTDFFNKSVASSTLDNYYLLRKGEFAYNKSYSKGYPMGAIKRLNLYESGVVTTLYICFKIKDANKANSHFFEQYFESGLLNKPLTQIAQEGGRDHGLLNVSTKDFFELKMIIPTKEEQTEIARILCAADKEIELHKKELDNLKEQKKGLMQLLLTGIIRVES